MSLTIPLPPNYFLQPPLSSAEQERYFELAQDATKDLIAVTHLEKSPITWSRDPTDDGNQSYMLYKGHDVSAPPGVVTFMCTTQLDATLDEIAPLFAAYTQDDLNEYRRRIAPDALDLHQLYVLASPTRDFPNRLISIKYILMKSGAPAIVRPRDMVVLDSNLDFECNGKRGFARAMRSIALPCVPDLYDLHHIVRCYQHRGGYVFVESDVPGKVDAFQLYQVDLKGQIPTWVAALSIRTRARSFEAIDRLVQENRLSRGALLLDESQLVAKAARSRCSLCYAKFRVLFTPKARCRKCGEVMCHKCTQLWNVRTNGALKRVRVCKSCSTDKLVLSPGSCWLATPSLPDETERLTADDLLTNSSSKLTFDNSTMITTRSSMEDDR
ncbi:Aste57867_13033 [Aphanomyces stellatus]|uniref:Aste57867_13033 protein n=1 Tax=Aphanomyces stellatus TaxID=120398 RepID=A0A485KX57_9STRA|nr:hypothetical protein As57867_012985 [Aphanomyces stellatus]VFT89878.1 Aste57867_13033 [Aphanomyces stellatus]